MRIGLREANQHFSKTIKAVKAGRRVVLTERGKPIAVISPLPDRDVEEATLERLIAEGLLTPAAEPGAIVRKSWRPVRIRGTPLSRTLRQERDAR